MTVLVFPSCLEAAARFADEAHSWRQRVVGASCLDLDPYASRYDSWEKLPHISDKRFFEALGALVGRHEIVSIFTPHTASYNFLHAELPSRLPHVSLIGDGPYKAQAKEIENALAGAERDLAALSKYGIASSRLPVEFIAGLTMQMDRIFGQCSREKALAICAIMSSACKGDVVEIGSLFGKSTFLFNRLASYLGIGGTLAVDPWNLEIAIQRDAPLHIQNAPGNWNWELVRRGFLVNMLACACPPFNYMRATSTEAFLHYCKKPEVISPEFGTTSFVGSLSVLHIDGNHDEASVAEDFANWSSRLSPGAWIIFDDYDWPYGDGPRKVADRALAGFGSRLRRNFLAGGALFINIEN